MPNPTSICTPALSDLQNAKDLQSIVQVALRRKGFLSRPAVLGRIEFSVKKREFVTILGSSGGGKTTLLRLIAGLDTEYDGEIYASGTRVRRPAHDRGIVFQESRLLPWLTATENVAFALSSDVPKSERLGRAKYALGLVGMGTAAELLPHQLSGGMEKRVALARALVNLPAVLLLDEPFSAVDLNARYALQDEVARIHAREPLTTLLVTHDIDEAVYLSDRILILSGTPSEIGTEIGVDIPRPRDRTSGALGAVRQEVLRVVLQNNRVS